MKKIEQIVNTDTKVEEPKIEESKAPDFKVEKPVVKADKDKTIAELSEGLAKANEAIELLKSVADKKALSLYYQRNKKEVPSIIRLRMINGKVIVGWRTVIDEVFQDAKTRGWIEKQEIQVLYEDDTAEQMSLLDFNRKYVHVSCNKKGSKVNDTTGDLAFILERQDNGKEYTVGAQYIN